MATYNNPGVYVSESPLVTNARRSNLAQATACFFGTAPRGPLDATFISSWSEYKSYYGDISPTDELGYSVYHYFANGGRDAYVVRVLHETTAGGTTQAVVGSASVPFYPQGSGASVGAALLFDVQAKSKGLWGNSLTVTTEAYSTSNAYPAVGTASQQYLYNLVVSFGGVEVERWNGVCSDPAHNRFVKTVVNTYSKYITIPTTSWPSAVAGAQPKTDPVSLGGGTNGSAVVSSDYVAAISSKLSTIEGALIMNAPGITDQVVITQLNTTATSRGNSFVVVDPSTSTSETTISTLVATYPQSSYLGVYYPMLVMVDPTKTGPGAIRDTYPGGAVVGAIVRTDATRGVYKAPAGYDVDIRNCLGLVTTFTPTETGKMYSEGGINLFKAIPGGGVVINGARSLDKVGPGKYIPIRRSLNYLKQALTDATAFAVFEPNDERLWTRLNMTISSILSEFWRSGGLKGSNAAQAFYIICDETNNTATTINNGEVRIEVGVALQYPAEFIVINLSQWTGGSNTVSTL